VHEKVTHVLTAETVHYQFNYNILDNPLPISNDKKEQCDSGNPRWTDGLHMVLHLKDTYLKKEYYVL